MGLRQLGIPLAEFVGGLVSLRIAMPLESIVLTLAGVGITLLGISGLLKPLAKPQPRPYLPEEPQA